MKKFIKPLIIVVIVLVLLFMLLQKTRVKYAVIGETLTLEKGVTAVIDDAEFRKDIFTDKTLADKTAIVVSFTIKNSSKEDFTIKAADFAAYYDGDADFRTEKLYMNVVDRWQESGSFVIEKISNKEEKLKTYILVPDEVIENTEKSLSLSFEKYSIDLRK